MGAGTGSRTAPAAAPAASATTTARPPGRVGRAGSLLRQRAHRVQHPLLVGEPTALQFGVDQLAVDGQLEAAAAAGDQLQVADLLLVRVQQLARQTEGLRLVVSHRTVFQLQVHGALLSFVASPP